MTLKGGLLELFIATSGCNQSPTDDDWEPMAWNYGYANCNDALSEYQVIDLCGKPVNCETSEYKSPYDCCKRNCLMTSKCDFFTVEDTLERCTLKSMESVQNSLLLDLTLYPYDPRYCGVINGDNIYQPSCNSPKGCSWEYPNTPHEEHYRTFMTSVTWKKLSEWLTSCNTTTTTTPISTSHFRSTSAGTISTGTARTETTSGTSSMISTTSDTSSTTSTTTSNRSSTISSGSGNHSIAIGCAAICAAAGLLAGGSMIGTSKGMASKTSITVNSNATLPESYQSPFSRLKVDENISDPWYRAAFLSQPHPNTH